MYYEGPECHSCWNSLEENVQAMGIRKGLNIMEIKVHAAEKQYTETDREMNSLNVLSLFQSIDELENSDRVQTH